MVRKEEVLARTSNGLDVFRHYLPVKWRVGRNFLNPLYADSKASCNVYYDRRSGTYRMKDFGNGDYSGDCFFLVAKLKGLDCRNAADFVEVLHTIDRELCLGLDGDSPTDGTVGTGGCRRLRLVPGARGGGAGEAGTDTEEAAVSADRPEPKPYRAAEKPFTEGGACLLGRIGHHRGGAAPLRDGIARRVPGRDEGGQGVRLQFHPGGTDVRVQGEIGREGLSPDVGGALRLWRAHGRQLLLRAGATALEGRPALPHGRREGRADAGGARLPRHLLQLGDLGHPGEDRAQAGLSLQAHRAAVRHGQDGAGMLGEAPCATGGVRGETAGAAIVGDEGGEGRDGLLQSRAHEGGADGAVPETARHAVRGHAGDAEIVRDRL
ncbi:hypothetical protein HMPREF9442_02012 [Paraprevotella xylaniphila YIT 11841]|uniref:Uncharacterized protein n=1 Tax=Paraprevotella xylaniphila YIT 11841 TaxID=762982 RepID=F3QUY8_9BACT|nr:hypothetical protein HMPREF9442_02012 [Paraprevotella xylaniphila YIT 11841]